MNEAVKTQLQSIKTSLENGEAVTLPPEFILSVTESQITLRCLAGRNSFFSAGEIRIPLSSQCVVFRLEALNGMIEFF